MRYYSLFHAEDGRYGIGRAPHTPVLMAPLKGRIEEWDPLIVELCDGCFPDYLSSDVTNRICSQRMRELLDCHAAAGDILQWLDVHVRYGEEERKYYFLHFPAPPDVLHRERSTFVIGEDDMVIKPVLDEQAAQRHSVFTYIGRQRSALVVAEVVMKAILEAGLTGIDFDGMPCA